MKRFFPLLLALLLAAPVVLQSKEPEATKANPKKSTDVVYSPTLGWIRKKAPKIKPVPASKAGVKAKKTAAN